MHEIACPSGKTIAEFECRAAAGECSSQHRVPRRARQGPPKDIDLHACACGLSLPNALAS
jgi:hypothetical protein